MTGRGQGDPLDRIEPFLIQAESLAGKKLSAVLDENERMIREIFFDDETVVVRKFGSRENAGLRCMMVLIDGMVNGEAAHRHLVMPVNECRALGPGEDALETLRDKVISVGEVKTSDDPAALAKAIVGGEAALYRRRRCNVLIINTRGWQARSVSEPEPERVIRGPRDGVRGVHTDKSEHGAPKDFDARPEIPLQDRGRADAHAHLPGVPRGAGQPRDFAGVEERLSRYSLTARWMPSTLRR